MLLSRHSLFFRCCLSFLVLASQAKAAPGDVDTTLPAIPFTLSSGALLQTAVTQADGRILVGGTFDKANGSARFMAARFSPLGVLDTTYAPNATSTVNSINVQSDGSAFYTGAFIGVKYVVGTSYVARAGAAKIDAAGGVVTTFNPAMTFSIPNGYQVNTIVQQFPGYYLIGTNLGAFRVLETGAESVSGFTPYPYGIINNISVQPDTKFILAGSFLHATTPVDSIYMDRVTAIGGKDGTFNLHVLNGQVRTTVLQSDGRVLVGGDFTGLTSGNIAQRGIMRYSSAGVFESSFRPIVDGSVFSIALQADGKILIGGNFSNVRSSATTTNYARAGIARLNSDGTVDPTFDAKISASNFLVNGIFIQADGSVLITGVFQPTGSVARQIARLKNDPIVSDLRALDSKTIQWLRGGAAPEAQSVLFEYSYDGSNYYPVSLTGLGDRIPGGWKTTFTTPLPASCFIRAQARVTGGTSNASTGIATAVATYPIPQIAVTNAGGTAIANGGSTTVATAAPAYPSETSFYVKNPGTGDLNLSSTTLGGFDAGLFTVSTDPATPVGGPLGSSVFKILFTPDGSAGAKNATVTIASNDAAVPAFSFNITGQTITDLEAWRLQYFGVTTPTGNAADNADPDGDGQNNLFEFVAGLIPTDATSQFHQTIDTSSGHAKITFSPRFTSRTYVVETSTTLDGGSWSAATGSSTDNLNARTFTDAAALEPRRFYRVNISRP
jgi:uncharacterized delta-60 repeat protein